VIDKIKSFKGLGVLIAVLGGTFWGISGCFGQYLFMYKGVTSSWLVPLRLFFSGVLILTILSLQRKNIFTVFVDRRNIVKILLFAVFGMAMSQYGYFTAVQYSNAGTATVIQYLGQIMLLVYVCVTTPRLPRKSESIALILSIAGIFIMATHCQIGEMSLSPKALFWGLLAALGFVCYSVQPAKLIREYTVLPVLGWGMLLGGLILGIIMHPWSMGVTVDGEVIFFLSGVVVLGSVLAYSFILSAIKIIGPVKTALISSVEPVVASIIAAAWLKTAYTILDIIGSLLILSAVFIITLYSEK